MLPILAALTLLSCKYKKGPEGVARRFLVSFNQLDMKKAKTLSTRDTWPFLDIMSGAVKNVSPEERQKLSEHFSIKIKEIKYENDSTATVFFTTDPQRLPFNELKLLRHVNSRTKEVDWKVSISTLDLLENDEIPDMGEPSLNEGDSTVVPLDEDSLE